MSEILVNGLVFDGSFAEGLFSPDIAKYRELCKKARKKEYHYQQQVYYSNLLQEIVVNRQVQCTCFQVHL